MTNLKGLMFCAGGWSSSMVAAKLNELCKPFNLHFDEGGLGAFDMEDVAKSYNVVLFAPHLRANYEEYEDLFEEYNVPFIQVEQAEYIAGGTAIYNLVKKIKNSLNL